ncbi:hypothetical protein ABC766_27060 [Methylobacterium fujisawaense]|uniref:hypothetical protein n=1 Tax=Methylobacterium fujisawaense TaxID=107400 RepID=UPI000DB1F7AF
MRRPRHVRVEKNRHGTEVVYFRRGDGERVRLPKLTHPLFRQAYAAALAGDHVEYAPKPGGSARVRMLQDRALKAVWVGARSRAASKELEFTLTLEWVMQEAKRQRYRCALTGIPFLAEPRGTSAKHPYGPSLDRKSPRLGYTPDNVRIVAFAVNVMLSDWGIEVIKHVARSLNMGGETDVPDAAPAPRFGTGLTIIK